MTEHAQPRTPPLLATVAMALWLGSLAHLLITVATLFNKFPKLQSDVAIEGAPAIFHVTEPYHLVLALLSLFAIGVWRRRACCGALKWMMWIVLIATILATTQLTFVTPRMDTARANENRPVFNRLHGASNVQYLAQTFLVLTAMLLLPAAIRTSGAACTRETDPATRPG